MKNFQKHLTANQTEKVGVKKEKRNNAGGISFKISQWSYLNRFLILGTEGGTYYVGERKLTRDAAKNVQKCIDSDGKRTVDIIVDISDSGRAANNDAAIFALAMCISSDSPETRKYALSMLNKVCRISTHLFSFMNYIKPMRGFGRGLREGIAHWYNTKKVDALSYQMLKYKGRDGWTHRDVLRLCHVQPVNKKMDKLFKYAVGKRDAIPKVSDYAIGARNIFDTPKVKDAVEIIRKYRLTREVLPTELLKEISVWVALLENMPMTALIRNLGKMSSLGMHKPLCASAKRTAMQLTDPVAIEKSRLHPLNILNALLVYSQGHGVRGSLTWDVNQSIVSALEDAFYLSFSNVKPTGKNIMLALDVSGSMSRRMSGNINNMAIDCREASAVLALSTLRSEKNCFITGFTSGDNSYSVESHYGSRNTISPLEINKNDSIEFAINKVSNLPFGATDCSLPMTYCKERNIDVDAIVIYTDNETWAGRIHPWQALDALELHLEHSVKVIVVGMVSTKFSIAKPDYPNMLDVVGFDANIPSIISEFIKN